ncbi:MAG: branched-chain amino acid ABC transporter ATP-binding protein [Leptolyngbya foveolarum]|uniref:Branched-chain amino acid ABC transporter ATP-binding protein n=1 Tax=Leptolyngbya foveolarum TaxID=47253 RepID=A0A2W4W609_9CYAN|nr:MAG: branched-chain amino acid ABC transporter ATP-binding protein [Leptolyngbya foveolarum]
MNIQPPPISPRQMNLMRVVLYMAWADDSLEQKEVDTMIERFSQLFAAEPKQQKHLQEQLQEYFVQKVPLEEAVAKLTTEAEKEVALRLSYEVIKSSTRTPEENAINRAEGEAYQKLLSLLALPEATVERAEKEATESFNKGGKNVIDMLAFQLREHLNT